jgi:hypothetical protein
VVENQGTQKSRIGEDTDCLKPRRYDPPEASSAVNSEKLSIEEQRRQREEWAKHYEAQIKAEEFLAEDIDPVHQVRRVRRRSKSRERSGDAILGSIIDDSIKARDAGIKVDQAQVYNIAQRRMYENEFGESAPSEGDLVVKHVPFPPDFDMVRLCPWGIFSDDPWPERSISKDNPVWSNRDVDIDSERTGGKRFKESMDRMYNPRPGRALLDEYTDSLDEFLFWEIRFVDFLRAAPLTQRRTLPFLFEEYRGLE